MDNETRQYLDDNFRQVRSEIGQVRGEIGQVRSEIVALEGRSNERLERVETALLTEFHKWASPAEARTRGYGGMIQALDLEVSALKDRVAELEKRKPS